LPPPREATGTGRSGSCSPHALGERGERAARDFLEARGWRVLESNYRFGRREVDLIAQRDHVLAFVEVKTRAGEGYGSPAEAVTWLKRREIEAVALGYLACHRLEHLDVRFDVLAVVVEGGQGCWRIEHFEDAWRPESPR
jgi:putative endonuclease